MAAIARPRGNFETWEKPRRIHAPGLAGALAALALSASPALCAELQRQFSVGITIVAGPCLGDQTLCRARSSTLAAPDTMAPNTVRYSRQADGVLVWTRTY